MDLLQLRYFVTAAKYCNITKAAKAHTIAQPAMSQTISKLEKELGCKLFKRNHNSITLTTEGAFFLSKVECALKEIDGAREAIAKEGEEGGEITLLVLQHRNTVIECISAFRKEYPKIKFNILYHYSKNEIFDMCISSGEQDFLPGADKEFLIRENLALAVSTKHRRASAEMISVKELEAEDLIFTSPNSSIRKIVQEKLSVHDVKIKSCFYTDDVMCVIRLVKNNSGCAVVPIVSWRDMMESGIGLINFKEKDMYRDTYLYWDNTKETSIAIRTFGNYLKRFFFDISV